MIGHSEEPVICSGKTTLGLEVGRINMMLFEFRINVIKRNTSKHLR